MVDAAAASLLPPHARLAGAPISWGVCEVPGWGPMLPAQRVLAEMAEIGLRGTELGAPGFLPDDADAVAALLRAHQLTLVGGFVPLVLHEPDASAGLAAAREAISLFARAGGEVLVLALVQDMDWSAPAELDDAAWRALDKNVREVVALAAERSITVALHPHVGTLVESADQVARALEQLEVGWCLDTGHLLIGGYDPVEFARRNAQRVVHVHLKDVDADVAGRVRDGSLSLLDATRAGLFRPLGEGDVDVKAVLDELRSVGYGGWLVLEQDTALTGDEPTVGGGPMLDVKRSIAFVHGLAQTKEERV
ncbi:MAG: TIM barrel protein [Solirubrobacteraceae bacterium]